MTADDLDVAPQSKKEITIPFTKPSNLKPGAEYWLNISFTLKNNKLWAQAGYEIAKEQFEIPFSTPTAPSLNINSMPPLSVYEEVYQVEITGQDFSISFDKTKGTMTSYIYKGKQLVKEGPIPNYWRAPNDNDKGNGMPSRCATWRLAGLNRQVSDVTVTPLNDKVVKIEVNGNLPTTTPSQYRMTFTIYGSGDVLVDNVLIPGSKSLPEIPEIGTIITVPEGFENIRWYGRGPQENYWDRNTGADVGVYSGTVDEQFFPYIEPSETGNKTDVRWVTLTDSNGIGLMAVGLPLLEANALHYTPWDLDSVDHPYKLNRNDDITLRLNHHQMGVGGDNSWGARPHPEFTLYANKTYSYSYRLLPVDLNEMDPMQESKTVVTLSPLSDIKINGESLDTFDSNIYEYQISYPKGQITEIPVVEAVPSSDAVKVNVKQAEILPGQAVITAINPLGERFTYTINFNLTTEIYASDVEWESATVGWSTIKKDKSIDGNTITLYDGTKDITFNKGIGTHANSEIVYDVAGKGYQAFQAYVGLDREATNSGSIVFQVYVDDNKVFDSGTMRRNTSAKPVNVDLTGANKLKLVVTDNGDGNSNDHADWADAKFILKDDIIPPDDVSNVDVIEDIDSLTLTWTNPQDDDLNKIWIKITDEQGFEKSVYASVYDTSVTIDDLMDGVNYAITIKAVDTYWNTSDGITVSGTPLNAPVNEPAVTITGPDTVQAGTEFKLNIGLNNVADSVYASVYAADITVEYDDDLFELTTCEEAGDNIIIAEVYEEEPGSVRILLASTRAMVDDVELVEMNFKAKDVDETATGTVKITKAELGTAPEGDVIEAATLSKTIQVTPQPAIVDKTQLAAKIQYAESLNEEDYTPESWAKLQEALDQAKTIYNDPNATQEQVDKALSDLQQAIDNLEQKQPTEKPFILIIDGRLDRATGIKATVKVKPVEGIATHEGKEVVLFQLMKDTTPVSIVAVGKDILTEEEVIAHFNVIDPENSAYRVRAFVFDQFNSDITAPRSLAEPVELQ